MLQTEKQQLRRYYREARRTLSSDEKRFIDCKISDNLLKSDLYRDAACIFCYVSTGDEIGTAAILEQALTDGKTLCVPLCGRAGEMSARRIFSLDELKSRFIESGISKIIVYDGNIDNVVGYIHSS